MLFKLRAVTRRSSDQSGVLHEVHQPRLEPEENALQEAERGVWSQNQRGDKVSRPPKLKSDRSRWTQFWVMNGQDRQSS